MDGRQGARTRAELLHAALAGGLGLDLALGNKHDVAIRKLLFQLAHQSVLDLVELLQQRHGHKHNEGFSANAQLHLQSYNVHHNLIEGEAMEITNGRTSLAEVNWRVRMSAFNS